MDQIVILLLALPIIVVALVCRLVFILARGTIRCLWKMAQLETYNVLAAVSPDGRARRTNVFQGRTFKTINDHFHSHSKWRWLIVTKSGEGLVRIIDLWQTAMLDEFPYVAPSFVPDLTFDNLDQAIGYIALSLC